MVETEVSRFVSLAYRWNAAFLLAMALILAPAPALGQRLILGGGLTCGENGSSDWGWVTLRDQAPTGTVTVSLVVADQNVATVTPATLTFTPAEWPTVYRKTYTVTCLDDAIKNPNSRRRTTLNVTLSGANYDGITGSTRITNIDDEPLRTTQTEGTSFVYSFGVLWGTVSGFADVVVKIESSNPAALTVAPETLTWTEDNSNERQRVRVTLPDNNLPGDRTATITHTPSPNFVLPLAGIVVTVRDDGDSPMLRFSESNYDVTEGEAAEVVLVLEPALSVPVDFALEVRPGTAVAEDLDANWRAYWRFGERRFSRGFRIPAGQTRITVPVLTARDTLSENAETLTVHVLRATIKDGSDTDLPPTSPATVTIRDVPPATPVVSFAEAVTFAGENAGTHNIRVNLRPALSSALNVVYVLGGTATGGVDYTIANAGSVGVPSGATSVTIPVVIVNDSEDEGAETVLLTLNAGAGYSVHATRNEHMLIITGDVGGGGGGGRGGGTSPNRLPTVTATCNPCVVEPGGEVGLTAVASDADGDTLTHSWSAPGGRFAGPSDAATTRWIAPDECGRFTVRVRVSDGRGGTASAEVTVGVEVDNRPPVFTQPVYAFALPENVDGRERPFDLGTVAALDPDGDVLTYEIGSGDRERFAIDATDGAVRYVGPGEDFEAAPNRYELTLRARDGFGGEARVVVAVTVTDVNEQPMAADDAAETVEDEAVSVDVLANDTDPEGDRLRVRSVTVLPVNDAPAAVAAIPPQPLDEGAGPVRLDLSPYFGDADGDALTYVARSGDTGVVRVAIAGRC